MRPLAQGSLFVQLPLQVLELPIRGNANKMFQFLCRGLGLKHAVATKATALYTGHFHVDDAALAEITALLDGLFDDDDDGPPPPPG